MRSRSHRWRRPHRICGRDGGGKSRPSSSGKSLRSPWSRALPTPASSSSASTSEPRARCIAGEGRAEPVQLQAQRRRPKPAQERDASRDSDTTSGARVEPDGRTMSTWNRRARSTLAGNASSCRATARYRSIDTPSGAASMAWIASETDARMAAVPSPPAIARSSDSSAVIGSGPVTGQARFDTRYSTIDELGRRNASASSSVMSSSTSAAASAGRDAGAPPGRLWPREPRLVRAQQGDATAPSPCVRVSRYRQAAGRPVEARVGRVAQRVAQAGVLFQGLDEANEILDVEARVTPAGGKRGDMQVGGLLNGPQRDGCTKTKRRRPRRQSREIARERAFNGLPPIAVRLALPMVQRAVEARGRHEERFSDDWRADQPAIGRAQAVAILAQRSRQIRGLRRQARPGPLPGRAGCRTVAAARDGEEASGRQGNHKVWVRSANYNDAFASAAGSLAARDVMIIAKRHVPFRPVEIRPILPRPFIPRGRQVAFLLPTRERRCAIPHAMVCELAVACDGTRTVPRLPRS